MKNPKRNIKLCVLFFILMNICEAQNFTWIKGPATLDHTGVYGSKGVSSYSTNPGGRDGAVSWKDASGNLWLFGGNGFAASSYSASLNDLWKYSPLLNEWTWINGDSVSEQNGVYGTIGSPNSLNKPGSRYGACGWTDNSGNLWLFGGFGFSSNSIGYNTLNDLWKYTIATNQWTWMKGSNIGSQLGTYGTQGVSSSANNPPAGTVGASWTDGASNFWIFGGGKHMSVSPYFGEFNDLWKYDPIINEWTWMKGSSLPNQNGTYGSQGISAAGNTPGGRDVSSAWTDNAGNLWLFGGYGYDAGSSAVNDLNDLWRYDPASNQWTWIKGNSTGIQNGIYGTIGMPAPANTPGSRAGSATWTDVSGDFWLFGGVGLDLSSGTHDDLNDLWRYTVTSNQWTWVKGSTTANQNGTNGSPGVSSPGNIPGSRAYQSCWNSGADNFWLFGGVKYDSVNGSVDGAYNDLWKLSTCTEPTLTINSPSGIICQGQTTTLTVSGANTYTWNTFQNINSITVSPVTTTSYVVSGTDVTGCEGVSFFTLLVSKTPTINIAILTNFICVNEPVPFMATGAASFTWSNNQTGVTTVITPVTQANLTVTCIGTNTDGCQGSASISLSVAACTEIPKKTKVNNAYELFPNPNQGDFTVSCTKPIDGGMRLLLLNSIGQIMFEQDLNSSEIKIQSKLAKGFYYYEFIKDDRKISSGKLIVE